MDVCHSGSDIMCQVIEEMLDIHTKTSCDLGFVNIRGVGMKSKCII